MGTGRLIGNDLWELINVPEDQREGVKWVATVVEIRDNATGEVRSYVDQQRIKDGESEPNCFTWKKGHESCDCFRYLYFARAAGEKEGYVWDYFCGNSAFSVRIRNKRSWRVFYDEFEAKRGRRHGQRRAHNH